MTMQNGSTFSRARLEQAFAGVLFGSAVALVLTGVLAMALGTAIGA
jgi:hypothetical protein